MGDFLVELLEGVFAGLIVLASYIYFNSNLDSKKIIKEFDKEDAPSEYWYDKPSYTVSFVFTIALLVVIVIFYDLRRWELEFRCRVEKS